MKFFYFYFLAIKERKNSDLTIAYENKSNNIEKNNNQKDNDIANTTKFYSDSQLTKNNLNQVEQLNKEKAFQNGVFNESFGEAEMNKLDVKGAFTHDKNIEDGLRNINDSMCKKIFYKISWIKITKLFISQFNKKFDFAFAP